jgi:hypothetical protein
MKSDFERGWELGYHQGLKDEERTMAALHKVSEAARLIPALEENRSTMSVGRKLRNILGLPTKQEEGS